MKRTLKDTITACFYITVGLGFFAGFGCATETPLEGDLMVNETFELKYGERRKIPDTGLEIEILEINDSRCPVNARCIRRGSMALTLGIYENNQQVGSVFIDAGETPKDRKPGLFKNFYFNLHDIQPYPTAEYDVTNATAVLSITKI
jgi:hypothetical protein